MEKMINIIIISYACHARQICLNSCSTIDNVVLKTKKPRQFLFWKWRISYCVEYNVQDLKPLVRFYKNDLYGR